MGKRSRIYAHVLLIHCIVQQRLAQHCKATFPQLKIMLCGERPPNFELFLHENFSWVKLLGQRPLAILNGNKASLILLVKT